jgi:outer membrane murein-binding lipoprotein Lpp
MDTWTEQVIDPHTSMIASNRVAAARAMEQRETQTQHMNDQMAKRKRDRERGVGEVTASVEDDHVPEQLSTNADTLEEIAPEVADVDDIVADAETVVSNQPTPTGRVAKRRSESVASSRSTKRSRSSQPATTTQSSATAAITQGVETLAGAFTRGMEGFGSDMKSALAGSTSRVAELSGRMDELRADQERMRADMMKAQDTQTAMIERVLSAVSQMRDARSDSGSS